MGQLLQLLKQKHNCQMGIVKRMILMVFIFMTTSGYTQSINLFLVDNLMIKQLFDVHNKDTIKIFNISSILKHEGNTYRTQTVTLQYLNDSLTFYNFEKFPNNGRDITKYLSDTCHNNKIVSSSELNIFLNGIILDLITKCQNSFNFLNKEDAKFYSKIIQQLTLVLDNRKLNFLIDYCSFINQDLISIETLFLQAKNENDLRKLFIISQSYMVNQYNDFSKLDFGTTRLRLSNTYEFHLVDKLFKKHDLRNLKKLISKRAKIQSINAECEKFKIPLDW